MENQELKFDPQSETGLKLVKYTADRNIFKLNEMLGESKELDSRIYYILTSITLDQDSHKALSYANKVILYAEESEGKNSVMYAGGFFARGRALLKTGNNDKALSCFRIAEEIFARSTVRRTAVYEECLSYIDELTRNK